MADFDRNGRPTWRGIPSLGTHVDLGPGIEAGVLQQSAGDWQWRLTGESEYFAVSEHAFSAKLTAGVGRKLGRNNSVTAGIELAETGRRGHSETFLRWQSYF